MRKSPPTASKVTRGGPWPRVVVPEAPGAGGASAAALLPGPLFRGPSAILITAAFAPDRSCGIYSPTRNRQLPPPLSPFLVPAPPKQLLSRRRSVFWRMRGRQEKRSQWQEPDVASLLIQHRAGALQRSPAPSAWQRSRRANSCHLAVQPTNSHRGGLPRHRGQVGAKGSPQRSWHGLTCPPMLSELPKLLAKYFRASSDSRFLRAMLPRSIRVS